jgi:hypothetical protein
MSIYIYIILKKALCLCSVPACLKTGIHLLMRDATQRNAATMGAKKKGRQGDVPEIWVIRCNSGALQLQRKERFDERVQI